MVTVLCPTSSPLLHASIATSLLSNDLVNVYLILLAVRLLGRGNLHPPTDWPAVSHPCTDIAVLFFHMRWNVFQLCHLILCKLVLPWRVTESGSPSTTSTGGSHNPLCCIHVCPQASLEFVFVYWHQMFFLWSLVPQYFCDLILPVMQWFIWILAQQ